MCEHCANGLLSLEQAAATVGMSISGFRKYKNRQNAPARVMVGRNPFFHKDELVKWNEDRLIALKRARSPRTCEVCGGPMAADAKWGVCNRTAACLEMKRKRSYAANAEQQRERVRRYRRGLTRSQQKARYEKSKKWFAANPDKVKIYNDRVRLKKRLAGVKSVAGRPADPTKSYTPHCQVCGEQMRRRWLSSGLPKNGVHLCRKHMNLWHTFDNLKCRICGDPIRRSNKFGVCADKSKTACNTERRRLWQALHRKHTVTPRPPKEDRGCECRCKFCDKRIGWRSYHEQRRTSNYCGKCRKCKCCKKPLRSSNTSGYCARTRACLLAAKHAAYWKNPEKYRAEKRKK